MKILQFFFIFFTIHLLIPNSSIALTCSRNQWLSANGPSGKCESCPRNATCNGFSYRCLEGYSYSSSGPCALRCPTNCISCSTSTCYRCKSGYTLVNGQCQKPQPQLTLIRKHGDGSIYSTQTISANEESSYMKNGPYYSSSKSGTTITQKCNTNYFWDKASCNNRRYDWQYCTGSTACEYTAVACMEGCQECNDDGSCSTCESGYIFVNNKCLKNSVSGSCPTGLAKSADGCCCIK